jgi:hypothetical protein
MSDLASLGVTVERGTAADTADVVELRYRLPKSTGVEATFSFEGLTERLVKIFRKEIQTGDALFDEHVHIKTDTTDATEKLLESSELRAIVEGIVAGGGAVEIDGASVKVELKDRTELEPDVEMHFVEALLR